MLLKKKKKDFCTYSKVRCEGAGKGWHIILYVSLYQLPHNGPWWKAGEIKITEAVVVTNACKVYNLFPETRTTFSRQLCDYHTTLASWRFALLWTLMINWLQLVINLCNKFHTGFMATTIINENRLLVNVKHKSWKTDVDRAVVKRIPLTPPNVDSATNTGIIHAMKPYIRWANVCHKHTYKHTHTTTWCMSFKLIF